MRWQTVKLGPVRWRRCVAVVGSPAGLWLHPRPVMGRFQPLLIPWADLRYVRREFLWWQSAYRFEVGQPAITSLTVLPGLYDAALRAYLPVTPAAP